MGRTLLVLDDDEAFCTFLNEALTEDGHTVHAFTKPREGIAALQEGRVAPDAIILDLVMPGMTGRDVVVALRADPALRDIPIVFISSLPVPNLAASLGSVAVLRKPFDLHTLLQIIAGL